MASISLEDVGRAMARRSIRLPFAPKLEARFEADTSAGRARMIVRQNRIGLIVYNLFMIGDWLLIPDIMSISVVLHLAVMTPLMLIVNAVVSREPPAWVRESILAFGIVAGIEGILALTLLSHSPLRSSEHLSAVLVILFATMVQRIRFNFVVVTCLVSLLLYVVALIPFASQDLPRVAVADAVFAGVVLFSLMGCYTLEAELRANYLLSLRDSLRNAELEAISRRDALTGAGNRRALDVRAAELAARAGGRRDGDAARSTAVLLFDIDFFKSFNDANGHLAGDSCLKRVATLIGGDIRLGLDQVFRFGGEEFLVVLEDTGLAEALRVGERIRRDVEAAAIPRCAGAYGGVITLSAGAAAGMLGETVALADLIADADTALYAAKSEGRNRIRPAPDDGLAVRPCSNF